MGRNRGNEAKDMAIGETLWVEMPGGLPVRRCKGKQECELASPMVVMLVWR